MKSKLSFLLILLMTTCFLCGCGKDKELEEYKSNMESFFEDAALFNDSINAIDPNEENASEQLLSYLEELTASIDKMTEWKVPERFEGVDVLAKEASENMHMANDLFHEAYANDEYKANVADAAIQYYERVNVRLHYIVSILHGEIPDYES